MSTCCANLIRDEQYVLSDLSPTPPGLERLRHGIAARSRLSFLRRVVQVGGEITLAMMLDRLRPLRGEIREVQQGAQAARNGRLALYAHWSPTGAVSRMVLGQLAGWRMAGFDVVFVSNSPPPADDWEQVGEQVVLRIARDNVGLDFGGWRDALGLAVERFGMPAELMLANDSVLGPLRPMDVLVDALRSGGDGLFGLTESRGGGAHLQSYLLLARGEAAVGDVAQHLADHRPSHSKWRTVQAGEIALTRRMLSRGHRVAALFGWDRVTADLRSDVLASFGPRFAQPGALARYPLNPTHHLWRVLIERYGFPYLKRELVLNNPGRLPGVKKWPELVRPDTRVLIEEHLRLFAA